MVGKRYVHGTCRERFCLWHELWNTFSALIQHWKFKKNKEEERSRICLEHWFFAYSIFTLQMLLLLCFSSTWRCTLCAVCIIRLIHIMLSWSNDMFIQMQCRLYVDFEPNIICVRANYMRNANIHFEQNSLIARNSKLSLCKPTRMMLLPNNNIQWGKDVRANGENSNSKPRHVPRWLVNTIHNQRTLYPCMVRRACLLNGMLVMVLVNKVGILCKSIHLPIELNLWNGYARGWRNIQHTAFVLTKKHTKYRIIIYLPWSYKLQSYLVSWFSIHFSFCIHFSF